MVIEQSRNDSKSRATPEAVPCHLKNFNRKQITQTVHDYPSAIVKDLRVINLLKEFFPIDERNMRVEEMVEVNPQPVCVERIFYSYTDDRTETRRRNSVEVRNCRNDLFSSTLFIFPKQRHERFVSELHYYPEHVLIRRKTNVELFNRDLSPLNDRLYENLDDCLYRSRDVFYRI